MILKSHEIPSIQNAKGSRVSTVNVLHLVNGEHFSGAERVQDLLAMALPEFGYSVGFVCVKPDRFPNSRQSVSSDLHEVPMKSKFDLGAVNRVVEIYRQGGYRCLHAHTPRTLLIGRLAAKKLECPLVYHVHSPVGRDSCRGIHNWFNSMLEKWSLKGVDRMICVSTSLAGYMEELGHPTKLLSVVCNGVPVLDDVPPKSDPDHPWTIGTMALFRPRKGTEVLLKAIAILKEQGICVNLRAVGPFQTPEYQAEVYSLVEELGIGERIEWTGFQQDVNEQLRKTDIFVLPSLYGEGLPMVVLEAMANGVPVVASCVEGIPEAVRHQTDGLIFEPGSPKDLADKLSQIVGNVSLWRKYGQNSLQRQRLKLSDTSMAAGVADIYDDLLQAKR
jgi:glycosyltransferase involved in cell wall biosynthesis